MDIDVSPTDDIIKNAAFNKLDPELWTALTHDDHIVDFYMATKSLRSTLQAQLSTYKGKVAEGLLPEDTDWYERTKALYARIIGLLQALRPKIKDRTRRHYDRLGRIRYKLLRQAIIAHQEATLAGGEPTEQDRVLWTALAETWALGSEHNFPGSPGMLRGGELEADAACFQRDTQASVPAPL
jgi:hypothetical protein